MSIPPYLFPEATDSARNADAGRRPPRRAILVAAVAVVIIVSAAAGASIDHGLSNDRAPGQPNQSYRAELRALGARVRMSQDALGTFGKEECAAARHARFDGGSALLKFKSGHVRGVFNTNDQVAIETFRTLFIATGYLLCADAEATIVRASRPLF